MAGFGAKVKLTVDKSSKAEFNKEINSLIKSVKITSFTTTQSVVNDLIKDINAKIAAKPIAIKKIDCSAAVNDMRKQLQSMIDSLSIKNGVAITGLKDPIGTGILGTSLDATKISLDEAKAAVERYNTQLKILKTTQQSLDSVFKSATAGRRMLTDPAQLESVKAQYDAVIQRVSTFNGVTEQERVQIIGTVRALQEKITMLMAEEAAQASASAEVERAAARESSAMDAMREKVSDLNSQYIQYNRLMVQMKHAHDTWTKGRGTADYNNIQQYIDTLKAARATLDAELAMHSGDSDEAIMARSKAIDDFNKTIISTRAAFAETTAAIKANGNAVKSWSDRLGTLGQKFTAWLSVSQVIMLAIRSVRKMITAVVELDKALTQIEIVTGTSGAALDRFADHAADVANRIGSTITDVVSSTETYARLGNSLEASLTLADVTGRYANVARTTIDEATASLTSIMKAFRIAPEQMERVVDMLVKVGQEYAISAGELGEAMQHAGAALEAGGNSVEQAIALMAAGNAAVQDASVVGNALKTTTLRIRSSVAELEEMGETVDDLVKSASSYRAEIKALSGVDIMLDDENYKSTYQILKEIASVWKQMTDIQQASLLEDLAGKRNANVVKSIITNLNDLEGAYEAAGNAAETLARANDVYMESIQAHIAQFKVAFQELADTLIGSDFVRQAVDLGTWLVSILNILAKLIDMLGGLKVVLLEIGGIALLNNIPSLSLNLLRFQAALAAVASGATTLGAALGGVAAQGGLAAMAISGLLVAVPILIGVIKLVKSAWDETHPSLEQLKDDYEESRAKLDELGGELKTTKDRIVELQKLADNGTISVIEEEELKRLKRQNELLKSQISIQKELNAEKANRVSEKASNDAAKWLSNVENKSRIMHIGGSAYTVEETSGAGGLINATNQYIEAREQYEKALVDGNESLEERASMAMEASLTDLQRLQNEAIDLRNTLDTDGNKNNQKIQDQIREIDLLLDRTGLLIDREGTIGNVISRFFDSEDDLSDTDKLKDFYGWIAEFSLDVDAFPVEKIRGIFTSAEDGAKGAAPAVAAFTKQMESLTALQERIGSLSSAFSDMSGENGSVSFGSLSKIAEQFNDVDGIDHYIARIAVLRNDADGLTNVMNELLGAYIAQKVAAGDLSDADEDVIEAMLREAGVANADEAAHQLLADAKDRVRGEAILAEEGVDGFIKSLSDEAAYSGAARSALIQLAAQMVKTNDAKMDFSTQIEKLKELGRQAGLTGALMSLPNLTNNREAMHGFSHAGDTETFIDKYISEINAAASKIHFEFDFSGTTGGKGGNSAAKSIDVYTAAIDRFREAIRRLNEATAQRESIEHAIERSDNLRDEIALQDKLIAAYEAEQAALHNLNEERDAAIHDETSRLTQLGFNVEYDDVNNKFWVSNLEHINELQGKTTESTNELRKEAEALIGTLEEWNEANAENSATWWTMQEGIVDAKKRIVEAFKEIVVQASEAVDSIQNVYDTLHRAADEYAANGGFISIDALQDVIALGPQYMRFLEDQNGRLEITDEKINEIIAAKTEELALEQALTYIERIRLAMQSGSVEDLDNLLYATTEATGATWDLVYANLALLGLDSKQYQAALHNINAIRALADTAVRGIGQTAGALTDELNTMKSGLDDLLKYVMDMLKQRVEDQIDDLEDLKDQYADIIELKKESIKASKEEADYEKNVAKQVREIAALQARIDALSLDNSRSAQAQRARLLEELADKQASLADEQENHAIEANEASLDAQLKAYEDEKDGEIQKLKESISSTEKLYRAAIDYISKNWSKLKDELIQWNYEVGTNFQYEIEQAWDAALKAAQRYGNYVTALSNIDADISAASGETHNDLLGGAGNYDAKASNTAGVRAIVDQMKGYSVQWSKDNTSTKNADLHKKVGDLAKMLDNYGVHVEFDGPSGAWIITKDENDKTKVGKHLYQQYHTGGIAGGVATLKQKEVLATLEKGEAILDKKKQQGVYRLIDFTSAIAEKLSRVIKGADLPTLFNGMKSDINTTQNQSIGSVMNNKTNSINFGDTYIYGASDEAAEKFRSIKRDQANEVLSYLGIRK